MRSRLARLALEVALATPGVTAPNAGPTGLGATWVNGERLPGVRVVPAAGGRWTIELGLTATLVPLRDLAEAVHVRVGRALDLAGLRGLVAEVDVAILDVEEGFQGTAAPQGALVW